MGLFVYKYVYIFKNINSQYICVCKCVCVCVCVCVFICGNKHESEVKELVKELVTQSCPTFVTPWTVACQVPLSIEFSRQEYWSG